MIEFERLKIGYGKPIANVNLKNLQPGKMHALIGSNGSGKSTFLKTICGKQKPIEGTIKINGRNHFEMNRLEFSKTVAFVPSKFPETDFMRVFDFIALGRTPYINNLGRLTQGDIQVVEQVIEQVNINHLRFKDTSQLSDGERQLCAVARALAQQTQIILLDEPTGFLDYRNKRRLLELLLSLTEQLNLLVIFSTHDIETIRNFDIKSIGIQEYTDMNEIEEIDKDLSFEDMVVRYYR